MRTQSDYAKAEKKVNARIGFYIHAAVFTIIMALLFLINFLTSPDAYWAQWPLIGWGLGIGLHAFLVFALGSGSHIKDNMIKAELQRETKRKQK